MAVVSVNMLKGDIYRTHGTDMRQFGAHVIDFRLWHTLCYWFIVEINDR